MADLIGIDEEWTDVRTKLNRLGGGAPLVNLVPNSLGRLSLALEKTRQGISDTKIVLWGDSIPAGAGAGGAVSAATRPNSSAVRCAEELTRRGLSASASNMFGRGDPNSIAVGSWDSRQSQSGGWTMESQPTLGGPGPYHAANTAAGTYSFTPLATDGLLNTVEIYNQTQINGGSYTVNVNGGDTLASVDQNTTEGITKTTVTFPETVAPVLNIVWVSGPVLICGVDFSHSTVRKVRIINGGWGGAKASDINALNGVYSPKALVTRIAPAGIIMNFGANEALTGQSISTYKTNYQALITYGLSICPVILQTTFPISPTAALATTPVQAAILQAQVELAVANNLPILDVDGRFVSYAAALASGFVTAPELVHPNNWGHGRIGKMLADAVLSV